MPGSSSGRGRRRSALVFLLIAGPCATAHADTFTWTAGNPSTGYIDQFQNWNNSSNVAQAPPNDGSANLVYGLVAKTAGPTDRTGYNVASITFTSNASAGGGGFILAQQSSVSLGIGTGGITDNSTALVQTILEPLRLTGQQNWNVAAGGTLNVSGGVTGSQTLVIGGPGTINLNGSGPITGGLYVDGGTLNLTGGTTGSTAGLVSISGSGNPVLSVNSSTAVLTGLNIYVGNGAPGTLTQSAGTVSSAGNVFVGQTTTPGGAVYNLSGGTVTCADAVSGFYGYAVINQTGGTFNPSGQLYVGYGGDGIYNLTGGTLITNAITTALNTGSFYASGGTVRAAGANASFISVTTASIGPGGLTIDTNGFNVSTGQPFQHNSSSTDGGLIKVGAGTLTLSGSNLYTGNTNVSAGTLSVVSGGVSNSASNMILTGGPASAGATLSVSGSGSVNGYVVVAGYSQTGTIIQTGGAISASANVVIGDQSGSTGTYQMSGGTVSAGVYVLVGQSGAGTFLQTGGVVTAGNIVSVGTFAGSTGTYALSGTGVIDTVELNIGQAGPGLFVQTGGTTNAGSPGNAASGGVVLGIATSTGTLNLSGGQINTIAANVGYASPGIINQTGGRFDTQGGVVYLGSNSNTSGTYLLAGGTLAAGGILTTATATGTLTFNGGILQAETANTNFLSITTAIVSTGGAIIDTNGQKITITQPLLHDPALGNSTIDGGLLKTGTGTLTLSGAETYTGDTVVFAGTLELGTTARLAGALLAGSGGKVVVDAAPSVSPAVVTTGAVRIGGGSVTLTAHTSTGRTVLVVPSLVISGNGWVDVGNNDLDLTGTTLPAVTALAAAGDHNGSWNGSGGIDSSTAAADSRHLTAVGVIQNNQAGTAIYSSARPFDGITPGTSDVLVKYTYYGDANLDGRVDGSDYSLIDAGSASHSTGWFHGDFNCDGVVDGSDYTLIDNAFNNQGSALSPTAIAATATAQIALTAVPEPTAMASLLIVATAGFHRRSRRTGQVPLCRL